MKLGRYHKYEWSGESDDDGDDEVQTLSYDFKKGFIFSAVYFSDDATYKCEAKSQNQKEVIYFYMRVGK
jgi:hypothetical protein